MAPSINCRWMPQIIGNLDFCATDHHFEPGALLCPVSQTCYHEKLSLVMHHLLFHESDEYSQLPCNLCAWTMGFRRIYVFHNLPRSLRVGWSVTSLWFPRSSSWPFNIEVTFSCFGELEHPSVSFECNWAAGSCSIQTWQIKWFLKFFFQLALFSFNKWKCLTCSWFQHYHSLAMHY